MTVRGDRPVRDSVVSRFSKEFPIPENCRLNEMKARLDHHEVLTITMPKKIITPEPAQPKDTVPTDQKPQQEAPSSPPSAAAADQTAKPPPEPQEEQIGSAPKSTAGAATSATGKEREKKTDEQTQNAPSPGFPEPKTQKGELDRSILPGILAMNYLFEHAMKSYFLIPVCAWNNFVSKK